MNEYLDIDLAWGGFYARTFADQSEVSINRTPLTRSCLEGYMYYLEEFEVPEDEREELMNSLIAFSKDDPLKLRLYLSNGELQIEERG